MAKGKKGKIVKKILKWALILVALYFVYIIGFVYFTHAIPMKHQPLAKAPQGIVVFTGTRARLKEGFQLLRTYPRSHLLISGVMEGTQMDTLLNAVHIPCCVAAQNVTLDYKAQDTIDNAYETVKWAQENNFQEICLITSNYHMPRSLLELNQYAEGIEITPHAVIAKSFLNDTWWQDPQMLRVVMQEYNKYLFAWLRCTFETYWA